MSTHPGEESKPGTMSDAKLRAAVEAALAGKKLPLNGPELIEPAFPQTPMMPSSEWDVGPRELSANAPANPFPGVPVISAAPLQAPIEEPAAVEPIPSGLPEAAVRPAPTMPVVEPVEAESPPMAVEGSDATPVSQDPSPSASADAVEPQQPAPVAGEVAMPPAAVPGAEEGVLGFDGPLVLRSGSPVQLTAVPGASVPSMPVEAIPVSEIASRASRAMEAVNDPPLPEGSVESAGSQRSVPMLGQLAKDKGMWQPLPGPEADDVEGLSRQPDSDSGFSVASGVWGGVLFGIIAGTLAWFQVSGADEVVSNERALPAQSPQIQFPPAPSEAKLTGADLFAVDAEWVKSATFKAGFDADPRLQAARRDPRN